MLINSQEFRREALYFLKHGKYDCGVEGTREYKEWWDEQEKRRLEGFSVGGLRITGEHYGYLNFAQIKLTKKKNEKEAVSKSRVAEKIVTFPDFWDGDYRYFHVKDIARNGCSKEELIKLDLSLKIGDDQLGGGKHLCVGKKRRAGYSYKNGWIAANRYDLYKNSITIIGAFESKFLFPGGTMTMATDYVDFLNKHTDWRKRKIIDRQEHIKSGFEKTVNGSKSEYGYKSQIIAVSFRDNPSAARGKDGSLIMFEEAGKFPNIIDSYTSTRPSVGDGQFVTGQMLVFGTGGGDNTN